MKILEFECNVENINFSDDLFKLYKIVFNSPNAKKPTNKKELIKLLVNSYKLLMPTLEIIKTQTTQLNDKGKRTRIYEYSLDTDTINKCNEILNIYGFIKKPEINANISKNCNIEEFIDIDEIDEEANINYNVPTYHQFVVYDKLFKYTLCNDIYTCSQCDTEQENINLHCVECLPFITSIQRF